MTDTSKGPSKPELGVESNEFKGTINSMSLKGLKTIRDRVTKRLEEVSESEGEEPEVAVKEAVEEGVPAEMTWEIDGKSFTLPVKDTKQIYKAFSDSIPKLKVIFKGVDSVREFERILRQEYMPQLSKNADLTNYDLQKFEYNINKLFEEGYIKHSGYHHS